jgi:hypothetical protein
MNETLLILQQLNSIKEDVETLSCEKNDDSILKFKEQIDEISERISLRFSIVKNLILTIIPNGKDEIIKTISKQEEKPKKKFSYVSELKKAIEFFTNVKFDAIDLANKMCDMNPECKNNSTHDKRMDNAHLFLGKLCKDGILCKEKDEKYGRSIFSFAENKNPLDIKKVIPKGRSGKYSKVVSFHTEFKKELEEHFKCYSHFFSSDFIKRAQEINPKFKNIDPAVIKSNAQVYLSSMSKRGILSKKLEMHNGKKKVAYSVVI